jgi:hypothetical protein
MELLSEDILKGRTISIDYLSGDDIRKSVIDKFILNNNCSSNYAFAKTHNDHQEKCEHRLIELIENTKNLSSNHLHIIYLDRNHPPAQNGIINIVKIIDDNMPD